MILGRASLLTHYRALEMPKLKEKKEQFRREAYGSTMAVKVLFDCPQYGLDKSILPTLARVLWQSLDKSILPKVLL